MLEANSAEDQGADASDGKGKGKKGKEKGKDGSATPGFEPEALKIKVCRNCCYGRWYSFVKYCCR